MDTKPKTTVPDIFKALTTGQFRELSNHERIGLAGAGDDARIWVNVDDLVVVDIDPDGRVRVEVVTPDGHSWFADLAENRLEQIT